MAPYADAMITAIDAHYYLAKDLDRAVTFYRDALGLPIDQEFPAGVEFVLADGSAFGIAKMPGDEWHQGGGVMFAVPDVTVALERVRAGGGSVFGEPMDYPVCTTAWCADPEGNTFALHLRK
jgi:predicted enzyme related to lactoylglutathione lyase